MSQNQKSLKWFWIFMIFVSLGFSYENYKKIETLNSEISQIIDELDELKSKLN